MSWAKSARRSCSSNNNTITHIDHKKVHRDLSGGKSSRSRKIYIEHSVPYGTWMNRQTG